MSACIPFMSLCSSVDDGWYSAQRILEYRQALERKEYLPEKIVSVLTDVQALTAGIITSIYMGQIQDIDQNPIPSDILKNEISLTAQNIEEIIKMSKDCFFTKEQTQSLSFEENGLNLLSKCRNLGDNAMFLNIYSRSIS